MDILSRLFFGADILAACGEDVAYLVLAQAWDNRGPLIDSLPGNPESLGQFAHPAELGNYVVFLHVGKDSKYA